MRFKEFLGEDDAIELAYATHDPQSLVNLDLSILATIGAPDLLMNWTLSMASTDMVLSPSSTTAMRRLQELRLSQDNLRSMEAISRFLRRLLEVKAVIDIGQPVLLHPLLEEDAQTDQASESIDLPTIEVLAQLSIIHMTHTEFGEPQVQLHLDSVQWSATYRISTPLPSSRLDCDDIRSCSSKFQLLLELCRQGWTRQTGSLEDFEDGGPKVFSVSALHRGLHYMKALLLKDHIFQTGFRRILHGMPDSYYKVLLNMDNPQLINEHPDVRALRSAHFEALLNGDGLPEPATLSLEDIVASENQVLALEDGDPDDDEEHAKKRRRLELPPFPVDLVRPPPRFPVAPSQVVVAGVTVHFDRCSHSSGLQRGYVRCPRASHVRCFKYRQLQGFGGDWQTCAAWLAVWATRGQEADSKGDHAEYEPYPSDIEAARAQIV